MKTKPQKLVALSGIMGVLVLGVVTWLGVEVSSRTDEHMRWVTHTEEVIASSNRLLNTFLDAETGQRGYIITGDERFLEPFYASGRTREEQISALEFLTRDNPSQQTRLSRLRDVARSHRAYLEQTIYLRRSGHSAAAARVVGLGRGKVLSDELRGLVKDMVAEEDRLLQLRSARADKAVGVARLWSVLIGVVGAVALLGATARSWRDITLRLTAEEKLVEANRRLEEVNERLNQFVGLAAHDLRSPLTVIGGLSKLLIHQSDPLPEASRRMAEKIHGSSGFMLRMVNNLLDISTIEAGRMQLSRCPTDIESLVSRNVEMNREISAAKGISIDLRFVGELPLVEMDAERVEQVLNNLISNAVKFSPPASTATVEVRHDEGTLAISVRDQGPGIPRNEIGRLFKPFSRTTVRATAGEKSTGLGLVIAKEIVEAHGGTIGVESVPGDGATFTFAFPSDIPLPEPAPAVRRKRKLRRWRGSGVAHA